MSQPPAATHRHSLSARLLRLTLAVVLAVEILVFVPDLARERQRWLDERLNDAELAVLATTASPDARLDPQTAAEVLHLARIDAARLALPGRTPVVLAGSVPVLATEMLDLRTEDYSLRVVRALRALVVNRAAQVRVVGDSRVPAGSVSFVFQRHDETAALRQFADNFFWLALLIATLTGTLVYVAALVLLVRPMRRIIDSIAAFRADPERTVPLDPSRVSMLANDEMAVAGRELAAMQNELRGALWRNARLAALGTAVAKISHDLRGILAPAMLSAERLEHHSDAAVRRTGEILLHTVDRANDLVHRTLDFVREGPPPLTLTPLPLDRLAEEAGETVRAPGRPCTFVNEVPPGLLVQADRNQFFRVLVNLIRNAAEAGARTVRVAATVNGPQVTVDVADDGPGLPDAVQAALFRPFAGSVRHGGTGLGLAIARDLMLAHGGDIMLASTGSEGTVFRLSLVASRPSPIDAARPQPARTRGIAPAEGADV